MSQIKEYSKPLLLIIIAFLISLVVRYPYLSRDLGIHNENATAHVLVTLKSYEQNPVSSHYFLPIYSYGKSVDKYINNMPPSSLLTDDGSYIYTSFPPLGFFVPYLSLSLAGLDMEVGSLRSFNLGLHFISTVLIFFLLLRSTSTVNMPEAVGASFVYLFLPEVMWSLSNSYWSHSLAQVFFLLALYFFAGHLKNPNNTYQIIGLFIATLLLCLTEWFGYIFALGIFLFFICRFFQDNTEHSQKRISKCTILCFGLLPFIAIALMLWHYSLKVDIQQYLETLTTRADVRSNSSSNTYLAIFEGYLLSFGVTLLLIIPFIFRKVSLPAALFFVSLFPILENFILASHSQFYTYAYLKVAVPLALLCYCLLCHINSRLQQAALLVTCIFSSVVLLYHVNSPFYGKYFYDVFKQPGELVKNTLKDNELGFVEHLFGHVVYYADRHLTENCTQQDCVEKHLYEKRLTDAKIYHIQKQGLRGYDIPFFYKYYYGFHNGVVHSIIAHQLGDTYGLRQTPVNFNQGKFVGGVSETKREVLIRKSDLNIELLDQIVGVELNDGSRCTLIDKKILKQFITLKTENCQLGNNNGFPKFINLLSPPSYKP